MAAGYLAHSKKSNNPEAEGSTIIVLRTGNEEQEFPIQIDCLDEDYQDDNRPIHLLPLLGGRTGHATREVGKDWLQELMIEGIVLQATGITKGEFSRIGSFNFYKNESSGFKEKEKEEAYEPFLQVLEEHGTAAAEVACTEITSNPKHPGERYVITIV
jgi:hypothetical protein